jgi:dTDP-4-dehydrorhamnose reductase
VSNIVILGATGQFGTSFAHACELRNIEFAPISHDDLEISNSDAVCKLVDQLRPNAVINATGVVDVGKCEADPERAFAVNALAVRTLANACAAIDCILVQTSTHLVFDGKRNRPYTEDDLPLPNTVYAASKLAGEHFALTLCPKGYAVRFPTLYGARSNSAQGFVEKMIARIRQGQPLKIADDRRDSPTWAFHAANAVLDLIASQTPFGLYHVANSGDVSYYDFISRLHELSSAEVDLERAKDSDFPSQPPKPLRIALKSEKLEPLAPWDQALADYVVSLEN